MSATTTGAVSRNTNDIPWNKHVRQKKTPADWAVDFVIVLLLVFTVVAVLYPLWFVVIASFSNPNAVAGGEVSLLPKGVTFAGYAKVFTNHRIWQGYLNTIIYSVVGTAVNMAVTIPCAFALSRREFKPRRVIMFLFTVTMFVSGGLIPNYLLYKALGINNTMWVFILPGAVSVYNVIVARSFFETSIPEELHDAAQIDGLSYFGYFFKIVLPLSSAILAVIGLYYFVGHWNDFMTGLIYITDDTKQPLQVVLQQLLLVAQGTGTNVNAAAQQQAADQIKFGIIIVSTLPLLVLYPFLQKYFNKGVMLGAVVLGFFPSCAAAQTTFRTWLRAEDRSMRAKEVWGIFHGAWKNELKQANLFGWPLAVCWAVLAIDYYMMNWHARGTFDVAVSGVLFVLALVLLAFTMLVWVVRANYDERPLWIVRTTLTMIVARPLCTLLQIGLALLAILAWAQWPGLLMVFGMSLPTFCTAWIVYSFGRIPGMDIHDREQPGIRYAKS